VEKEGVNTDTKRVEAINNIPVPRNKKDIQVFLGKIKFLMRHIPNYVEIIREITNMLKKYKEVKWTVEYYESFSKIKGDFAEAPMLVRPDNIKQIFIFSFASPHILVVV